MILLAVSGLATAIPAAALVTETAGVSIPSATVNPAAKRLFGWQGLFGVKSGQDVSVGISPKQTRANETDQVCDQNQNHA